jgi:two-component system sensor histidine kinase UhpB
MHWFVIWLAAFTVLWTSGVRAQESSPQAQACAARIVAVQAARVPDGADPAVRPAQGWENVTLPEVWSTRWRGHEGSAWYRIDWEQPCSVGGEPVALGIDGFAVAGEVFSNDDLLWRDQSMVEPLSLSWNMPRWWLLPASSLRPGVNSIWVRVVGLEALTPGLGALRLGTVAEVERIQAHKQMRQRTVYVFSMGLSAAVGCLFGMVWLLRRNERAFGWYALMSLAWTVYMGTVLAEKPWPFMGTLAHARLNMVCFVAYVVCFCLFTWRFGGQALARSERALWALAGLACAVVALAPEGGLSTIFAVVWVGFLVVFLLNCLQFQWHAWRPRPGGRDPQHMLLALCWLLFLVLGVHDALVVLRKWHAHETLSAMAAPVTTVCMALLLGWRLVAGMRRIERFNNELEAHTVQVRSALAQALEREHVQALDRAKMQERLQIAHDLHDGLGSSLVRSMALVEQSRETLDNDRVLSLFKVLRDDLRQVIDYGTGASYQVPETPMQWLAPLRHRFTALFDELGVRTRWQVPAAWPQEGLRPTPTQSLGVLRLLEETLANVIKHSRAKSLRVECLQPTLDRLELRVIDDGVGFNVEQVRASGLGVGLRSMAARAERFGGTLTVLSGHDGTCVSVQLARREVL